MTIRLKYQRYSSGEIMRNDSLRTTGYPILVAVREEPNYSMFAHINNGHQTVLESELPTLNIIAKVHGWSLEIEDEPYIDDRPELGERKLEPNL
jgi:hypothetical protein